MAAYDALMDLNELSRTVFRTILLGYHSLNHDRTTLSTEGYCLLFCFLCGHISLPIIHRIVLYRRCNKMGILSA